MLAGKSVLIVSPGVPHPREGASTVLFYQYIRGIADAGARVLNILLTDATNRDERLLGEYLESMRDLSRFEALQHQLKQMYGVSRWTRAPHVLGLPPSILERTRAFHPDAVVCLDLLSAAYARQLAPPASRVVWLGDLNFQTFWYNATYDRREHRSSLVRLPLVGIECLQWRRFYASTLADARAVIVSSKASEPALQRLGIRSTYLPYPWPAKAETSAAIDAPVVPTFAFFGSLSGLGSRSAFDMMINHIYPRLVAAFGAGGFRLLLAGTRTAPAWVTAAVAGKPEIVLHGFVDDLVAFMRGCHAVLVPIEVPVGNRSRILTAMAHGSLVVAHANTAAGNPDLVSGENCLLARSPAEFVAHLRFAAEQPEEGARIAARGQQTYLRLFSPALAVARFVARVSDGLPVTGARA